MGKFVDATLGDVIELKRGYDLPQQDRVVGTVPIVSSSGTTDHHSKPMVNGPGVITGRYGTLGQVFYLKEDFWPLNTTLYVKDFKGNDPRFVSYFLRSLNFHAYSDKAAVPGLNRNHLHVAPVRYPANLDDQRAIASTLGALDDKIDLNRRLNETLEAMARAIFKDWFVDFAPTRAKMEGRPPYLAPEIWSLFPDRLDNEGKPVRWTAATLSTIARLNRDALAPSSHPVEYFDHYSIPAYDNGQEPIREPGRTILSNKMIVPRDAVLLSKLNPEILRVWLVIRDSSARAICSTEFLVFSPLLAGNRAFLYCALMEDGFRARLQAMVTGTSKSHQRVSPQSVLALDIIAAPRLVMDAFCEVVTPMLDRVSANRRESRTLAAIRDLLLPKLMSGEIRVKEAENAVEAVA
jgi:type I restriction enzyme S subunit